MWTGLWKTRGWCKSITMLSVVVVGGPSIGATEIS